MKTLSVESSLLWTGHLRLNASYYEATAGRAEELLRATGFPLARLGDAGVTDRVFNPPRFKRIYVNDEAHGVPYLTGAEMLTGRPEKRSFISRALTPNLDEYVVHESWVLITDSGTIGRSLYASRDFEGFAVTNNVIRVVAGGVPSGYLYAWVSSPPGQALITRDTYGSVIDHIEPHHVRNVPVPLVDRNVQRVVHDKVQRAAALRAESNRLFDEAERELLKALGTTPEEWSGRESDG
ncbi:MAG: hypothetical protein H0X16_06000 [Chloroflexi bacterium]|nr:hypothetical protein [Chloroflexota bacterium]